MDLLSPCGTVLSADIYTDKEGASLGVGRVVMGNVAETEQVHLALEGREFDGIPLMVLVGNEPSAAAGSAIETLESVTEFRKAHPDVLNDQMGHRRISNAIEALQGRGNGNER